MVYTFSCQVPLLQFSLSVFFGLLALKQLHKKIRQLLLAFILVWVCHMTVVLFSDASSAEGACARNWTSAYKILFNFRWLGTDKLSPDVRTRETATVHEGSQNGEPNLQYSNASRASLEKEKLTDPFRRSLRRAFLLKRLSLLQATYTLNAVYWPILIVYHPVKYSNFDATNQTYFRRFHAVSARETLLRAGLTVHFVWEAWALITSYHNALAIVFVSLGLDEPRDWPPIYGSISETYIIKRFWGKFWHRLTYRTYKTYGAIISENFLRLRPGGVVHRLAVEFFVFLSSGAIHAMVTWQLGYRCGYWEDIAWFSLNFVAILVEGLVQKVDLRLLGGHLTHPSLGKVAGSVWVFTVFFWSLPKT
ncbi:hypothetical protein OEA41_010162 [Lepraria neglecta]|uniref:Wax synthase domain-containing protein n=1 Tax=Lepraria neglecta TaxID=209136 RepID=A0AAE0DDK3_9LECA|nr:hypothetical protein OEA41_010162 [Lepraria neglecta]